MSTRRKVTSDEVAAMSEYRRRRVRTCARCNGWFLPSTNEYGRGATLYCSEECAAEIKAERRRAPGAVRTIRIGVAGAQPRYTVAKTCEHCGRFFRSPRQHALYCSGKCRVAAHRARKA